jgi:hypothetical protein
VFLGDITMPCHPGLTTFQHPSDLTVEIQPCRSMDLRLFITSRIRHSRVWRCRLLLSPEVGQRRADHSLDLMVRKEPKGSSNQRSWSPRGFGLQRFWLHCHSAFLRQDSAKVPCVKPSTRQSDGRKGAQMDSLDQRLTTFRDSDIRVILTVMKFDILGLRAPKALKPSRASSF